MEQTPTQRQSEFKGKPELTFDSFVTGDSNYVAYSAAAEVAERPGAKYNPLFIFCNVGQGKTHLLHAIGWDYLQRNPTGKVQLLNADEFSEELAHQIEAGADFFLMPSEFEPCGLNQMISQRYGTPPIVHRVGGLADSVTHASPAALQAGEATGVVFDHFDAPALSWAVDFARDLYARPAEFGALRRAGMVRDFSWRRSGVEYERLYRQVMEETNGAM